MGIVVKCPECRKDVDECKCGSGIYSLKKSNNKLNVKIKKLHEDAVIPKYAKFGDAGMDMTATSYKTTDDYIEYDTSLAFEIPEGYVGLLFPRSSLSKYGLTLCNSVGVLDSSYRGSVKFRFNYEQNTKIYVEGDRIGQIIIMPYPQIEFEEVEELDETERAKNGFGSSGS